MPLAPHAVQRVSADSTIYSLAAAAAGALAGLFFVPVGLEDSPFSPPATERRAREVTGGVRF